MGCGSSKLDELPLVIRCRERREFVRKASEHRYALAAAHISYFRSLRDVGEALRRFSDEELVFFLSASVPGSPVLTLPSDKKKEKNSSTSYSSETISHEDEDDDRGRRGTEGSHLHLSGSDSDLDSDSGHIQIQESPEKEEEEGEEESRYRNQNPNPYPYPYPYLFTPVQSDYNNTQGDWGSETNSDPNNTRSFMFFSKKSETKIQSMVYEEPETDRYSSWYSQYSNNNSNLNNNVSSSSGGGSFFGFSMGSPAQNQPRGPPEEAPLPPPPPPSASPWDYLNFFDTYESAGYEMKYNYGSNASSPDSNEVREREGIPELEDETDPEASKLGGYGGGGARRRRKKMNNNNSNNKPGTSNSRSVPAKKQQWQQQKKMKSSSSEGSSRPVESEIKSTTSGTYTTAVEDTLSAATTTTTASKSSGDEEIEESFGRKKGVSFEDDEVTNLEVGSSKRSVAAAMTVNRQTRDIREVVKEIRDEFETASSYGKEVAVLLEVGKLPYQPRANALKGIFSRILYLIAPSMLSSSYSPSRPSIQLSSKTLEMAKEIGESGKDPKLKSLNLSSTLEKLHAWEKKLHKEVKDEERLRVNYEKQCRRLRDLDKHGAESGKIDATQASIRKLLTKINVCIKAVDVIATRIHKLRDEELLPQVTELIRGLIRMWKSMLKCHQKQFQAIMESKMRKIKGNSGGNKDTGLKATIELEMELLNWCTCFNNWVSTQKSYVESLHEWLSRCIVEEPEQTDDGLAPFSPSRVGAPMIFVVCNDWYQAMERISPKRVSNAMSDFASTLHQLWERQDVEQRQRIKAEFLSKDFEKRLRQLRTERGKLEQERDASSDKTALSRVPSGSGISPLDDLKVDLDSMRNKLSEERERHKEAIKLVQDAASNSLQAGLTPIFEALGNFTSHALKAHEEVRLQNPGRAQGKA